MDGLVQDLRYGARMLRKNTGFTLIAVFTLALGVGANAAIFSVLNAVLLRPLPFRDPGRLVAVLTTSEGGRSSGTASYPNFLDWRAQNHVLQAMSVWRDENFTLIGKGEPVQAAGMVVSANLFSTLGVSPELGREFAASEDRSGSTGLPVVLSHRFWLDRLGGDPQVLDLALRRGARSPGAHRITPFLERPRRRVGKRRPVAGMELAQALDNPLAVFGQLGSAIIFLPRRPGGEKKMRRFKKSGNSRG